MSRRSRPLRERASRSAGCGSTTRQGASRQLSSSNARLPPTRHVDNAAAAPQAHRPAELIHEEAPQGRALAAVEHLLAPRPPVPRGAATAAGAVLRSHAIGRARGERGPVGVGIEARRAVLALAYGPPDARRRRQHAAQVGLGARPRVRPPVLALGAPPPGRRLRDKRAVPSRRRRAARDAGRRVDGPDVLAQGDGRAAEVAHRAGDFTLFGGLRWHRFAGRLGGRVGCRSGCHVDR
mmetsp:Transcript_38542/g.100119  ORF Transcript_38542/g.100119 Transcript_38542/m.100119 type:complete len:237 (+) Transcript_38542:942-1652(+)